MVISNFNISWLSAALPAQATKPTNQNTRLVGDSLQFTAQANAEHADQCRQRSLHDRRTAPTEIQRAPAIECVAEDVDDACC